MDEGQFLAHADLEGVVRDIGEGGLIVAASVEGIPQRFIDVGGDDCPGGEVGTVLFRRRQWFARFRTNEPE